MDIDQLLKAISGIGKNRHFVITALSAISVFTGDSINPDLLPFWEAADSGWIAGFSGLTLSKAYDWIKESLGQKKKIKGQISAFKSLLEDELKKDKNKSEQKKKLKELIDDVSNLEKCLNNDVVSEDEIKAGISDLYKKFTNTN